ncbi:carboxyl-terminal processing protease CtpA [Pseudanabaena sp. FACHB-2040]|uniref:carboxyl-terminal processing protease CtpA n=1 Tax=Pseudanabaena sp. FACHB-2040 TaxID=2692859 RepID=UPI0016829944|nr:carboxyl-terminal processing protease CtpA [Pseudanabaena sp. FACHB-2040]MBD2260972.1 PDZ domain-containing protein [Pseudanabaena sp. FACHB-2040]
MRARLRTVIFGLVLLGFLWLGVGHGPAWALTDEQNLVSEVWRIVNRAYLDETFNHQNWWFIRQRALKQSLNDRDTTYTTIQGMLAVLEDPYTRLLRPEQYRSLQTSTSGELTGVGLQITKGEADNALSVIAPIEGSPAEQAGIQPKDRVLKIEGTDTHQLTLDEAANRMRGPAGTKVTLTLERTDTAEPFEVTLVRDRITLNPVSADLRATPEGLKVGYLRLSQFNANASSELSAAIKRLEKDGADAYILDLRNNPGGLLQAGIEIARLWLDEGTIVYTVSRQGILDSFEAHGPALTEDPLVVLVNEGTASASEILAGALQDNGRAQLVGTVTFGKGLIQSLFDLSDGAGLAVTVAKYETPDHHDINRLGITPDQVVEVKPLGRETFGTGEDPQYQAALELLGSAAVIAGVS